MAPVLGKMFYRLSYFSYASFRGAINPARDFGPRCMASFIWGTRSFVGWPDDNSYYFWWNPIVGPMIGGAIGKLFL